MNKIAFASVLAVSGLVGFIVTFTHGRHAAASQDHLGRCDLGELKGTYSFNGLGYAPQPPPPAPVFPIVIGGAFTIQDVGSVYFDGLGHSVGYTSESVGGLIRQNDVAFEGTYELHRGPHGEGCTGTWKLQDHHTTPPLDTEPPHVFKIALARASKGFQYTTVAGPLAALSGFASLDLSSEAASLNISGYDYTKSTLTDDDIHGGVVH